MYEPGRNNGAIWKNQVVPGGPATVMATSIAELEIPVETTEAYHELMGKVHKRTGKLPPEVLVRHVLRCVPATEWPVRVEATDAVLRRLDSSHQDKLRVESRPADGHV